MVMAMFGILVFGAIVGIPRWLRSVDYDPAGHLPSFPGRQPTRSRWAPFAGREKRRVHDRGHSRGKSPHHAGL